MTNVYTDHRAFRVSDKVPVSWFLPELLSGSLKEVEGLSMPIDITTLSISFEKGPWPDHFEYRFRVEEKQ